MTLQTPLPLSFFCFWLGSSFYYVKCPVAAAVAAAAAAARVAVVVAAAAAAVVVVVVVVKALRNFAELYNGAKDKTFVDELY
jgi:3-oxoacyl-ACP reductase-like protein